MLAKAWCCLAATTLGLATNARALDYPYTTAEPQKSGWPLTEEERKYVLLPEHERRPGREINQHKPAMWPVTPSAGFWGGTSWLDTHASLIKVAQANKGPIDVLLVGDSITMQWGAAWPKHFPTLKTVNLGIGGDKTQNVLWRLDHGGVDGLEPRVAVLLIGNNNMFFTPETGIEPAARGVKVCVDNLREKFPKAAIIVVKVFPAHAPGNPFYEDIKKVNAALDTLNLETDPKVRVLDIWCDMVNADGTLKKELFTPDNIHLSQEGGYKLYAEKLKPLLEAFLAGKEVPKSAPKSYLASAPAASPATDAKPAQVNAEPARAKQVIFDGKSLLYPYTPYNEGKMDPQLTGWPLTDAEKAWVAKNEYTRKPGHEVQKHLPEMWFVTPAAARWGKDDEDNVWVTHHATCIEKVRAMKNGIDIAFLGDSITQGWGGGWDGAPFNAAWQKHFGGLKTVNLGIGGDRMENILWRLDHDALDGTSPKVIVLKIGVNNAPLVFANGAPAASAAHGIKLCIENLRMRCPKSEIVLVKILPAFDPSKEVGAKVREINAALDALKLDRDPQVHVLDLWSNFTNADGTLKTALYSDGHLHLSPAGYEAFASKLKPLLDRLLRGKGAGFEAVTAADASAKGKQPRELPPCGVRLTIVEEHPVALIAKGNPGTEGNKHGFEGGRAMKLDGVYHVFTAEMVGDPLWVKMRLGHWTSPDRLAWTRRRTMYESSGDPTGKDSRASFWSPMPVYNEKEGRWNFFYVAYRAQVGPLGWNGRIWRAVSKVKGPAGIDGPWEDVGVILQPGPAGGAWEEAVMSGTLDAKTILQPGPESDPWEGSQGVDSFFPYQVGDKWLGFYGSCNGHNWFKVGLAEAPELAGPWKRLTAMNPVDLVGTRGPENPVVHCLKSGRYIALFEVVARENGFGYADSPDGIHWTKGSELPLTEAPKRIRKVRTPLGLVPEPDGTFTIFFTGYTRAESWGEMWMVRVRVEECALAGTTGGAAEIRTETAPSTVATSRPANAPARASGVKETSLVLYGDELASGWSINGWGGGVDTAKSSPVHGGKASMAVTLEAGGGQGIMNLSGIGAEPYNALNFWIHGGPEGGQILTMQFCRGTEVTAVHNLEPLPANEWRNIVVPLSAVGLDNVKDFTCLRFVDTPNATPPVFYVDDLQLIGAGTKAAGGTGKSAPAVRTAAPAPASPAVKTAVAPHPLFCDNMVLQRDAEVPVWGWAKPGETVTVEFGGVKQTAVTDANGKWTVKLPPMPASAAPRVMTFIGADGKRAEIRNVVVGEVWLCGGQSNMEMVVRDTPNPEQQRQDTNLPLIRMATLIWNPSPTLVDRPNPERFLWEKTWRPATPEHVLNLSAVGYFFGRELHRKLGVPVGLITSCKGGSPAEAWMPREVLLASPELAWTADAKFYHPQFTFPGSLWNGMIHPLVPYRMRGAIWYQGEDNLSRAWTYRKTLPALIAHWRKQWGVTKPDDLPFGIVQLAGLGASLPVIGDDWWAELRESQAIVARQPGNGLAVALDTSIDDPDIHPNKRKEDVGKRLAYWALNKVYQQSDVEFSGPVYASHKIAGDKMRLSFNPTGGGLTCKGNSPTFLAIAGEDRQFKWATAVIDGDTIVVSSPQVPKPVAVRYAWSNGPGLADKSQLMNVFGKNGLPLAPFRTDDWPLNTEKSVPKLATTSHR